MNPPLSCPGARKKGSGEKKYGARFFGGTRKVTLSRGNRTFFKLKLCVGAACWTAQRLLEACTEHSSGEPLLEHDKYQQNRKHCNYGRGEADRR